MQYALIDGVKLEPAKGLKGLCPSCGKELVSKCGNIKIHHWAHKNLKDCDSWSEPETEWHRKWKNQFPEEFREVVFNDPETNETHRADVHTGRGITLEFQNSPISKEELKSREKFYTKLIWVVNGQKFKGFQIIRNIPSPDDPLLEEFEFAGKIFFKKTEIMASSQGDLLRVYGTNAPELKGLLTSNVFYEFNWKNKHEAWFSSTAPVFIDFGDDLLYWLKKREQILSPFWYIKAVQKSGFILKYSK